MVWFDIWVYIYIIFLDVFLYIYIKGLRLFVLWYTYNRYALFDIDENHILILLLLFGFVVICSYDV